jgi:hypothetical protein
MSFLDAIPAEISDALAPDFRVATIGTPTLVPDGEGGFTSTFVETDVKALRIEYELDYRLRNEIPATDVSIIVLRYGLTLTPGTDHRVTIGGVTYSIIGVATDPADATWTLQARPI